ncbi:MAG: cobyrinate a,c-diamide synthase [Nitrospinae bacterium]|nr:cobyrinate a,c-diamide synthase [Nitrospinota bacterium]
MKNNYPRIIIAGTHSGVGKTTISIGLMSALQKRGWRVQPFKIGPDFIDPGYHTVVVGTSSRNLDSWLLDRDTLIDIFIKNSEKGDISIIEGVMGLYDGYNGKGEEGSTAHIAKLINSPVILVVDASGMARSVGALVLGFEVFDKDLKIVGVIFNNINSQSHFRFLKDAVEDRCKAEVLGYLSRDINLGIPERHLGLITHNENILSKKFIDRLIDLVEKGIDIEKIIDLATNPLPLITYNIPSTIDIKDINHQLSVANNSLLLRPNIKSTPIAFSRVSIVRIAVAYDPAFCFYYEDNLDILRNIGGEILFFSPIKDTQLPRDVDVIYLGGGYPEVFAQRLEANHPLRDEIRRFADIGRPIYAECGGFMYLTEGIIDLDGRLYDMVGIFPTRARMLRDKVKLGYVVIKIIDDCLLGDKGDEIHGHEFHYSEISFMPEDIGRSYELKKGEGDIPRREGYTYKNVLASYVHIHFGSNKSFAERLIQRCLALRSNGYMLSYI